MLGFDPLGNRGSACGWVIATSLAILASLAVPAFAWEQPADAAATHQAHGTRGMVVAVSPPAVEVGVAILQAGGNAVDSAVAVALAMAVTWPEAGNLGGGGFMMIWPGPQSPHTGTPECIEYRETAPAAATERMFALSDSRFGHRVVGTPGTVRGLALAHRRHGRLPWKQLIEPARRLAEEGFTINQALARSLNGVLGKSTAEEFPVLHQVFQPPRPAGWQAGDHLRQPDLAATLAELSEHGPDAFYTGRIAEAIVAEMRAGGGLLTAVDLADYQAKVRQPIHGRFRGYDIYGPPPPSSGGIAIVQMLNILEHFDLNQRGPNHPETLHLLTETMRRVFLDRARHLGDTDFVTIPPHLTDADYARTLAESIDRGRASSSEALAPDIPLVDEPESTTHFCVVDADGMGVSNTYTLEMSFGSRVVVRGAGFLLNNEMGDFNWKPGHTDRAGRIGTPANRIEPGKRMLSSQSPTLVARDGKLVLLTGSPGGRTIINTVLRVIHNRLEFDLPLGEAVAAPRLHHAWLPDRLRFEGQDRPEFAETMAALAAMGHTVDTGRHRQGDAHSIAIDPATGRLTGVADTRRDGPAAGF